MPAIVTNDFRFLHSNNFINSIKNADQSLYVFVGKDGGWTTVDAPEPTNTRSRFLEDSSQIEILERVYYKNLSRVSKYIPHEIQEAGESYEMYSDSENMAGSSFFVVNSSTKGVYKCLYNNPTTELPSGSPSTVAPTSTQIDGVETTSDKYVWKYMYTIPDEWGEPIDTEIEGLPLWMSIKNVTTREESSSQWDVRMNSLPGGIHAFKRSSFIPEDLLVENGIVNVVTDGDGEGFVGKIINGIIVCDPNVVGDSSVSPGFGYDSVTQVQINGEQQHQTTNIINYIQPIMSPSGGHGSDPIKELNGFYILVDVNIHNTTDTGISFRKLGLISNPLRQTRTNGESNELTNISSSGITIGEKLGKKTAMHSDVEQDNDYLKNSGEIIYIENKTESESIGPNTGIKQVKLILSF